MDLRYRGLAPEPFLPLFRMSDADLAAVRAVRVEVDEAPGYPDRVTLTEIPVGGTALLVNHVSLDADTPYRTAHAIYVWQDAREPYDAVNVVPEVMRRRLLSLRAFDAAGMMLAADVAEGTAVEATARRLLEDPAAAFLHVHNARQGCYAGRIERA